MRRSRAGLALHTFHIADRRFEQLTQVRVFFDQDAHPLDTSRIDETNSTPAGQNFWTAEGTWPPPAKSVGAVAMDGAEVVDVQGENLSSATMRRRWRAKWLAMPSWAVSLIIHVVLLVAMAAVTFEPLSKSLAILTASTGQAEEDSLESFDLPAVAAPEPASDEPMSSPEPMIPPVSLPPPSEVKLDNLVAASVSNLSIDNMIDSIAPTDVLMAQVSTNLTRNLDSRSTNMKRELLEKFGGTAASEKAVAAALKWIASHQLRNGSWSFAHNRACQGQCGDPGHMQAAVNGATAISLLPFLGAGQTHLDGAYKENVRRGLDFLIKNMDVKGGEVPRGSWHENPGNMYSHGLAAIAICEAYAMTRDPDLIQPAQLALNYIVWSQDPVSGGWRYGPQQAGDTSVVGWQVMALKSGSMGNLFVPPTTVQKASFFLDTVQSSDGTTYGYTDPGSTGGHKPCTPIGLLCRMYLGMDKSDPAIKEGVAKLAKEGVQKNDIYYNYYAAQVLRQHGGPEWETFNGQLRDWLVETQVKGGHADGSWHFGDSIGHRGPSEGGRLCSTAFATMILEVYYRHMPLYGDKAGEDSFEL